MEYAEITSQSGTTHYVNPAPKFSGEFRIRDRVQTLCEFHVRPENSIPPSGTVCERCRSIARLAAGNE